MTTRPIRQIAWLLAGVIGLTAASTGVAHAGSTGRRNTTLGLGALALYGIVARKPLLAGLAGAGTVYSYMQYDKARRREKHRRRYARYYSSRRYRRYASSGYYRPAYTRTTYVTRRTYYSRPRYVRSHHRHAYRRVVYVPVYRTYSY
jgi:hypothetical protein